MTTSLSLAIDLTDDISGVAWLIEHDRAARGLAPLTRGMLAFVARSRIAREDHRDSDSRESTPADSSSGRPVAELVSDPRADRPGSIVDQVAQAEAVQLCLETCRATDARLTDAMLASLADGPPRDGRGQYDVSTRDVGAAIGRSHSYVSRRMSDIRRELAKIV